MCRHKSSNQAQPRRRIYIPKPKEKQLHIWSFSNRNFLSLEVQKETFELIRIELLRNTSSLLELDIKNTNTNTD